MATMIDQMVRAMDSEIRRQAEEGYPWVNGGATEIVDPVITVDGPIELSPLARAILRAIREPTVEMIIACGDLPGSQQEYWQRSIDAALAEEG